MKGTEKLYSFANGRRTSEKAEDRLFIVIDPELREERITNKCSVGRSLSPRSKGAILLIFLLIIPLKDLFAQTDTSITVPDTLAADTVQADTSKKDSSGGSGLDARVDYSAEDSMRFDRRERMIYLYGNAKVKYKDIQLKAEQIRFSFEDRTVVAHGVEDSSGKMIGQPVMKEGGKEFDASHIRYNFRTKNGVIKDVHTQEGKGDLYSQRTKKHANGEIHVKKGKYTTCTLKDYYIRFNKAVVIPGDKIVSGPANLVVGGIPTPLLLPFGYYPETEGGSSGIVLPRYGESQNLGFFLQEGGYYWRFEPYIDTRVTADIYSKGSWGVHNLTRYNKRYRFNGKLKIDYKNIKRGDPELPNFRQEKEFFIKWRHEQDPKARPNSNFSANVNIGTKDNFRNSMNSNTRDYVSNSFQSNIDYSKNWPNNPFSVNASLRHNQNTQSGDVRFSLPDIGINMNRIYPLEGLGNEATAGRKWYEKIGVNYTGNIRNRINTKNRQLRFDRLDRIVNDKMRYGWKHNLNLTTSLKQGFVSVTPRIGISDRWYLETLKESYDPATDTRDTSTVHRFRNAPDGHASLDLTTKVYGMYQFLGDRKTTIRHVLTPNVGFTYRPSTYKQPKVDLDSTKESYDPFRNTVFGGPTTRSSGKLRLGLINNFEGKYKAINDSNTQSKKFKIIDNLAINSSYDMMADSLNWSPVRISARTTLLENFNIRFQSSFDPYAVDSLGQKIDKSIYKAEGQLLRWESASLTIGGDLKSKSDRSRGRNKGPGPTMNYVRRNPEAYVDFTIPWNLGFNYNLRTEQNYDEASEKDISINETIDLNGNVRITDNWKVEFRSGYDPNADEITYTKINIYRDLNCWEMSFEWVPFGNRKRYSFQINLSSPLLKDLKLQKKEQWVDQNARLE